MAKMEKIGIIVSDRMDKSVIVEVEYLYRDPIYRKNVIRTKRYMVHDEENNCKMGDKVRFEQTRPQSRRKHWCIKEIISKSLVSNKLVYLGEQE